MCTFHDDVAGGCAGASSFSGRMLERACTRDENFFSSTDRGPSDCAQVMVQQVVSQQVQALPEEWKTVLLLFEMRLTFSVFLIQMKS